VDRNPANIAVHHLALAGVQAGAYLDPEWAHAVGDSAGTADRSGGAVEGRQEPVPGRLHLTPVVASQLAPHDRLVACEQLAPASVAELGCALGGGDDVGEHDRREDAIGLGGRPRP
jgi:hypothetical protein